MASRSDGYCGALDGTGRARMASSAAGSGDDVASGMIEQKARR